MYEEAGLIARRSVAIIMERQDLKCHNETASLFQTTLYNMENPEMDKNESNPM